jgi:hypothetical protein
VWRPQRRGCGRESELGDVQRSRRGARLACREERRPAGMRGPGRQRGDAIYASARDEGRLGHRLGDVGRRRRDHGGLASALSPASRPSVLTQADDHGAPGLRPVEPSQERRRRAVPIPRGEVRRSWLVLSAAVSQSSVGVGGGVWGGRRFLGRAGAEVR